MTDRELVEQSLAELRDQVDRHQRFVRTIVGGAPKLDLQDCVWTGCRHRRRLCKVLIDAIGVLEDTRKAFKSKQLEELKRKFVRVLEDETGDR